MEENSAAVECLILFYINMKQVLKTKQLTERIFIDQMIKHCKKSGFSSYNDEEIRGTWKNLVSKYMHLRNKGTAEDKESWKYYEILDSCYEPSDFHNGVYPKFSEEMVWFMIECFLKRRVLKKTQKHNSIVAEIHKEFLQCGYLYITKQDIENKWRYLNLKYDKLKDDPASLKKLPYLEALREYREDDRKHIVRMVFTKELTEILIERFTEKKITCVIRGYDSDEVLNEIQSEFIDLGFYFSKDDIKEKWSKLTNIYKFLIGKGKSETSWLFFNAMKNHFQDDFLTSRNRVSNDKTNKQNEKNPRRIRQRSKSVGADLSRRERTEPNLVIHLAKMSQPPKAQLKNGEKIRTSKKSAKRPNDDRRKSNSHKKLRKDKINTMLQKNVDFNQALENKVNTPESGENLNRQVENKLAHAAAQLRKLSTELNQERRGSTDMGSPKVHIINIDHSDIDRKSGNLTINLPSITKQFSDNEFLPLKKRLRVDDDNIDKLLDASSEIKNGFLGFSATDTAEAQRHLTNTNVDKRLTEEEMNEIMERINREKLKKHETDNDKPNDNSTSYYNSDFNEYQDMYNKFGQHCLLVPKEECQENLQMQNYASPSTMPQPPVLLLVIKVDGSNNALKESISNEININMNKNSSLNDNACNRLNKIPHASSDIIKPVDSKGKKKIQAETKEEVSSSEVYSEPSGVSSGLVTDSVDSTTSQVCGFESNFIPTSNQLITTHNTAVDSSGFSDAHIVNNEINDICTIGENVTVYTTEENESGPHNTENNVEVQKPDEVIFREPLAVDRTSTKPKANKTLATVVENSEALQVLKNQTRIGKIRLPVKTGGKMKEIFISPRELSKIAKLKPEDFKAKSSFPKKLSEMGISKNTSVVTAPPKRTFSDFKFMSQTVKPAVSDNTTEKNVSRFLSAANLSQNKSGKNEEFENESVISEAIGDDEGLKDNLLATVIDFQEQNNQEFIEIKNLMKQNNLLQRETNRLLRLVLEK